VAGDVVCGVVIAEVNNANLIDAVYKRRNEVHLIFHNLLKCVWVLVEHVVKCSDIARWLREGARWVVAHLAICGCVDDEYD
jgi:hypothetical protein